MKIKFFVISVLVLAFFTSCYETNVNDEILEKAGKKLILSAENGRENSSSSGRAIFKTQEINLDDSYYRDEVDWNNITTYTDLTPVSFILDIDNIYLYEPKDSKDPEKGAKDAVHILGNETVEGWIIPDRINMLSSKNFSTAIVPKRKMKKKWNGLLVNVLPGGFEESNGGMVVGSLFCVKLPDGLKKNDIKNALGSINLPENIAYRDSDDYVWIGFDTAIPFKIEHMGYMCFQNGFDGVGFVNPDHENGDWVFGPATSHGNPSAYVLPMDQIDFSNLNDAEFVFMFDTDKCMDIYPTTDGRYWITLKKNNPLPFKIVTEEYDINSVKLATNQVQSGVPQPIQCFEYIWTVNGKKPHLIFTYTRPTATGVDKIVIYSSENETFNKDEVKEVYRGNKYCYVTKTTPQNKDLYYFICTVNKDGEESVPVSFTKKVTNHITF